MKLKPCSAVLCASALSALSPARAEPFDYHSVRGRETRGPEAGLLEGEHLPMHGTSKVQGMRNYGVGWSGDAHLLWEGEVGESMKTTLSIQNEGRYRLAVRLTKAPDYGVFSSFLDGTKLREGIDLYDPRVALDKEINLGVVDLKAGSHDLVFNLTGANPKAKKFKGKLQLMGLDYLKLVNLAPPKPVVTQKPKLVPKTEKLVVTLAEMRPVMATYCFKCHGDKEKVKGKVDLKKHTTREAFLADIELTRKVAEALAYQEMPPEDEEQLPEAVHRKLSALFDGILEEYLKASGTLRPVVMRRMNRYEYNNAVRDLLKLKGDLYPLPEKVIRGGNYFNPASGKFPDAVRVSNRALGKNQIEQHILTGVTPFAIDLQAEHGFNNRGDELSVSPILLESFLKLGRSIVNSREFDRYSGIAGTFFAAPRVADQKLWPMIAEQRLRPFLERAFRSPVPDETAGRYLQFFSRELKRGESFQQAMKSVVAGILASPRFLYIIERKRDATKEEPLTTHELATRLSFFFWSSIPDEELLEKVRSGDLVKPGVYAAQVKRMLEDRRSKALAENFARQWLRLDQLITAVPDFDRFEIYYSRRGCEQWKFGLQTMVEPLLLFESIMVEDRSIMLLVDSNYSYRSDELQSWYKDEVPFGKRANRDRFNTEAQSYRRRTLDTRREGGVMTSTAALTMTSSPLRTNPIRRGAWVATVIFNKPPPPPPDVVPEIESDDAVIEATGQTLRQRLIAHQENQSCISCHQKIDPLGFALENYDAIGRWRDKYSSGLAIDATGELFGKLNFKDVVGLKGILLENPEWFMRAFSEHLLSYALGRELDLSDKPAVDQIVRQVIAEHGKFSTVVSEIASSYPFLHKTNQLEPRKAKKP
ncbi:MAG: DUF1588 domain-containing protein [Roseibacillus sp.]